MKKISALLASLAFSFTAQAGSFVLSEYNLVTIGDVNASALHVDGKAFIGGNLNAPAAIGFAEHDNSGVGLTVGGVVASGGDIAAKGYVNIEDNGNTITTYDNGHKKMVNGRKILNATDIVELDLTSQVADMEAALKNASAAFAAMASNSALNIDNKLAFDNSLTSSEYAVFSLDGAASIFNNDSDEKLEVYANNPDVAGIIINVAGDDLTLNSGTEIDNWFGNNKQKVLWNFFEATTITLNKQFNGSILAPLATLTSTNNIEGSVGVLSIGSSHAGEIHTPLTTIIPPTEVPEPSTLFIFAIALVSLLTMKSRRKS